jgi:hypothetical protein
MEIQRFARYLHVCHVELALQQFYILLTPSAENLFHKFLQDFHDFTSTLCGYVSIRCNPIARLGIYRAQVSQTCPITTSHPAVMRRCCPFDVLFRSTPLPDTVGNPTQCVVELCPTVSLGGVRYKIVPLSSGMDNPARSGGITLHTRCGR